LWELEGGEGQRAARRGCWWRSLPPPLFSSSLLWLVDEEKHAGDVEVGETGRKRKEQRVEERDVQRRARSGASV
jgi:hypothetical protein